MALGMLVRSCSSLEEMVAVVAGSVSVKRSGYTLIASATSDVVAVGAGLARSDTATSLPLHGVGLVASVGLCFASKVRGWKSWHIEHRR